MAPQSHGLGFSFQGLGFRVLLLFAWRENVYPQTNWTSKRGFPKFCIFLGGPYNKDCNILGSMLGSPCIGKVPSLHNEAVQWCA